MKWFLKTAFREARHTRIRGIIMLFSMVFGLTVLVSFSALKQGFQESFYGIATVLTGGDLRVEIEGRPTERFRHLLPRLGDEREAYGFVYAAHEDGQVMGDLRYWVVDLNPRPLTDPRTVRDMASPESARVTLYGTREQLERAPGEQVILQGGIALSVQQRIEVESGLLPVWTQRLIPTPGHDVVIAAQPGVSLTTMEGLVWNQVWVYHFKGASVRERMARARYVLGYLQEESQGIRLVSELPGETGFYQSFQLISNTLFLSAFSALMLGTLAYTVTFVDFSKGKTTNVALLRCLGGSRMSSWSVYGSQVVLYGGLSVLLAGGVSIAMHSLIPRWMGLGDASPIEAGLQWRALVLALGFGGCFMLLPGVVSVLPLLGCEPIEVLRSTKVPAKRKAYRWVQTMLITLTALLALGFCLLMVNDTRFAVIYLISMVGVFGLILAGVSGLRLLLRRLLSGRASYVISQASANLFRAQNHYGFTLTSIAFGLFLITFLAVFFEAISQQSVGQIAGYAGVQDSRIDAYLDWLQRVFFLNQWLGVTLMVIGMLAIFVLLTAQRRTRLYEAVILSTLGASSSQIRRTMIVEAVLAGLITTVLGPISGVSLGFLMFGGYLGLEIGVPWLLILCMIPMVLAVMVGMGSLNLKGIIGYPPLEVLRKRRHFSNW